MAADTTDVTVRLILDTSSYMSEVDTSIKDTEKKFLGMSTKQQSAVKSVGDKVSGVAKVATTAAVAGLGVFVKSSLDTYKGFSSGMSQVAATLGYSVQELSDPTSDASASMEMLTAAAREMGKTTKYTAGEAAQALNYMALAGYDAETSVAMLPKVFNLATAGGLELATASDMITDTQSALGLSLEQTDTLINQMAKTASKSNTSVGQLGAALLTVGGTGKLISNQQGGMATLNAALGILADNGVKGSEGGTALRNMLLSLTSPTDKAAKVMENLGLEVFDASGNMKPFDNIMLDLSQRLDGLSDKSRTNIISTIFHKNDLKSVNALLDTSVERWVDLQNEITLCDGAAATMAETMEDNLGGDITKLQNAWNDFKISFAERLEENVGLRDAIQGLTKFISEHGTEIAQFIGDVVAGVINIATGVANFLVQNPWVLELAGWLVGIITTLTTVTGIISGVGTVIAALTSPIGIIVGIAALIGTVATEIALHWDELCTFFSQVGEVIGGVFQGIGEFVGGVFQGIGDYFDKVAKGIKDAAEKVGKFFGDIFEKAYTKIKNIFGKIGDFFSGIFTTVINLFRDVGTKIGDAVGGAFKGVVNSILGFVEGFVNLPVRAINGLIDVINVVPGVNISRLPLMSFPRLASGGIVPETLGGRLILAGEGGQDEWVVPESKMASLVSQINDRLDGAGAGQSITININGTFATSATERRKVAEQIVEAINQNNRRAMLV